MKPVSFSTPSTLDVHAYVKNGKFCVVNNTYEPQSTTVYRGDGSSFSLELASWSSLWADHSTARWSRRLLAKE